QPMDVTDSAAYAEIVSGCAFGQIADLAASQAYRDGNRLRRATVDLGGAQTGIAVALRKDDVLLGILRHTARNLVRSPTSRSRYCRTSRRRRSSRWRMRGCWANCASERTRWRNSTTALKRAWPSRSTSWAEWED